MDESVSRAIFIAGGIGITPVSAMARRAKALGIKYELHYSGRSRETMAFLDELKALHEERLHVYVANEGRRNDLSTLLGMPQSDTRIYACGPERMLRALEECCAAWPEDALHTEHFASTAGRLDPTKEHAFEVELRDSGLVIAVGPNQTLLKALRAANIDVQSDCEEGLCGSCEVRVLGGQVDHRDLVLTRAERDANVKMMVCCSRAKDKRLVLEL